MSPSGPGLRAVRAALTEQSRDGAEPTRVEWAAAVEMSVGELQRRLEAKPCGALHWSPTFQLNLSKLSTFCGGMIWGVSWGWFQ